VKRKRAIVMSSACLLVFTPAHSMLSKGLVASINGLSSKPHNDRDCHCACVCVCVCVCVCIIRVLIGMTD